MFRPIPLWATFIWGLGVGLRPPGSGLLLHMFLCSQVGRFFPPVSSHVFSVGLSCGVPIVLQSVIHDSA